MVGVQVEDDSEREGRKLRPRQACGEEDWEEGVTARTRVTMAGSSLERGP